MGTRIVPNGGTCEIQFPVKTTKALRGIGEPGGGGKAVVPTLVTIAANDWVDPYAWVSVFGNNTAPYITYPVPSTTDITTNDGKTNA